MNCSGKKIEGMNKGRWLSIAKQLFLVFFFGIFLSFSTSVSDARSEVCTPQIKPVERHWLLDSLVSVNGRYVVAFNQCSFPIRKEGQQAFYDKYMESCWFCTAFNYMISAINRTAVKTYAGVKKGAIALLSILLSLWLVYQVLTNVTILHAKDQGAFYTKLGAGLVRACIAAAIIGMGSEIWHYFVSPIVSGAFEYADIVSGVGKVEKISQSSPFEIFQKVLVGTECGDGKISGGVMQTINKKISSIIGFGILLFRGAATEGGSILGISVSCLPFGHGSAFISGVMITVMGWALLFIVPIKLVDPLFRIGVSLVLLPLFVIAWVFPSTRGYTVKGFNMFLQGVLCFLIMIIMISLITELMSSAMKEGNLDQYFTRNTIFPYEKASESVGIHTHGFLILLAYCFFAYKVVGTVDAISNFLAGAAFSRDNTGGIQKAMLAGGKMAGKAGVGLAALGGGLAVGGALKALGQDGYSVAQRRLAQFVEGTEGDERKGQGRAPEGFDTQQDASAQDHQGSRKEAALRNQTLGYDDSVIQEQGISQETTGEKRDLSYERSSSAVLGEKAYDVNKVELTNSPAFKEMSINQKAGYIRNKQDRLAKIGDFVMGHLRKFAEGEDYHRYL